MTDIAQPRLTGQTETTLMAARRGVLRRYPMVAIGALIFVLVLAVTVRAPWLATHDPQDIDPTARLRAPSLEHLLGTDALGRDVWSRTLYGGRISLTVGLAVGLLVGLVSGYSRVADAIVMRIMHGLMSIPAILLAIALMSATRASVFTVIAAITVAPRQDTDPVGGRQRPSGAVDHSRARHLPQQPLLGTLVDQERPQADRR